MLKTINTILLIFILSGCVSTSVTKLSGHRNYKPVSTNSVSLYLEPEDVECDFERLALINTKTDFSLLDNDKSINAAKKEAAEIGGNGLILKEYKYLTDDEGTTKIGAMVAIYVSKRNCR